MARAHRVALLATSLALAVASILSATPAGATGIAQPDPTESTTSEPETTEPELTTSTSEAATTTEPGTTPESTNGDTTGSESTNDSYDSYNSLAVELLALAGFVLLVIIASWWMIRLRDTDDEQHPPRSPSDGSLPGQDMI